MALNVLKLASQMLSAALPLLANDAQEAGSFAKTEFLKIAQTIAGINEQVAAGEINQQQAELLLDMQTLASRNVLLTLKGLDLLAVEDAINAALGAVKEVVNTALGFTLIA
jgi:hypothetical protein